SPSTEVLDPLFTEVLLITNKNSEKTVIINIDHAGMSVENTGKIRKKVSDYLKIPISKVIIKFTHTHSGPEIDNDDKLSKSYFNILIQKVLNCVKKAESKLRPCKISQGVTMADIGINRREKVDGKAKMGVNPEGEVNNKVGIIKFSETRKNNSHPLCLLVICNAHANVLKGDINFISGDYIGWTRKILKKVLNCPVLILNGAAGNINSRWRGNVSDLNKMSLNLSGSIIKSITEFEEKEFYDFKAKSKKVKMELVKLPKIEEAKTLAEKVEKEWEVSAKPWLDLIRRFRNKNKINISLELEISFIKINHMVISGIPMEPFVAIERKIKDRLKTYSEDIFFGGYTNGYFGYLPDKKEYNYGGYEVKWMPVVYGPKTGMLMPVKPEFVNKLIHISTKTIKNMLE
ncbi:MAG: alkaline ceramidase, partial [Bacillota bacterium]